MRFDKNSLLLYAVGGKGKDKDFDILGKIESAIAGGVTLIQLREKYMSGTKRSRLSSRCHR